MHSVIVYHLRNKSNLAVLNTWETNTIAIFPSWNLHSLLAAPPLLAGDPPSRCSASSIQAGNPHPTHILLLPHPTCPDCRCNTFHPNHRPLHQISAALSHGARSIAKISRSIWQRGSKSRAYARMRSRWLPFVPTPRSWRSTLPFASYAGYACSVYPLCVLLLPFLHKF